MSFLKAVFNSREEEKKMNDAKTHKVFEDHNAQSEKLRDEWSRTQKPTNFWKSESKKQDFERKMMSPNFYIMGYDKDSGEPIKANCVESVLYITKKRAGRL